MPVTALNSSDYLQITLTNTLNQDNEPPCQTQKSHRALSSVIHNYQEKKWNLLSIAYAKSHLNLPG